jgi:hypothetical protein
MKTITVLCHDCGEEKQVIDKFEDFLPTSSNTIKYCGFCGSDNIEIE